MGKNCVVNNEWKHPKYQDTCKDYMPGGSAFQYQCEALPKEHCCTCSSLATAKLVEENAEKIPAPELIPGGGGPPDVVPEPPSDIPPPNDEMGGKPPPFLTGQGKLEPPKAEFSPYLCQPKWDNWTHPNDSNKNCDDFVYGALQDEACERVVQINCCTCIGGDKANSKPLWYSDNNAVAYDDGPHVDKGDNILKEFLGPYRFRHKKHLAGGFIIYWNLNQVGKFMRIGLLAPPGSESGWVSVGFSRNGLMAGADTVVGWFDPKTKEGHIDDYHIGSNSASGVLRDNRQGLKYKSVQVIAGRMALIVERPLVSSNGWKLAVPITPYTSTTWLIYASGAVHPKCLPHGFCSHNAKTRWTTEVAWASPPMTTVYESNLQQQGEPCEGPAKLECISDLTCYHSEVEREELRFEVNFETYGYCTNPKDLGAEEVLEDEEDGNPKPQLVFANGGGFSHQKYIEGGFWFMWSMNYQEEVISCAIVSTRSNRQGWLGFGFSPNGGMKGADAVIGWDDGNGNSFIGDYFLAGQASAKVTPSNKQELLNMKVLRKNGQTAILFDRPWEPADSVYITDGPIHVILAAGAMPKDNVLPYHTFRYETDVTLIVKPGIKVQDVNGAKHRELCGGIERQTCNLPYNCVLFEQMSDFLSKVEGASMVGQNVGPPTPKSRNLFAIGRSVTATQGVCLDADELQDITNGDIDKWTKVVSIDESQYDRSVDLMTGIKLWWKVNFDTETIKIAMTSRVPKSYFSVGFSPSGGMMTGSNCVLGWLDEQTASNTNIKEYLLMGKLPWQVVESSNLDSSQFKVNRVDGEMSIEFERPLKPESGLPILPGANKIIYAIGNQPRPGDEYFGYHRFRDAKDVTFYTIQDRGRR
jgi:hypothetical protein